MNHLHQNRVARIFSSTLNAIVMLAMLVITTKSYAQDELQKVLQHKVEVEKQSIGIAVATIEDGKVRYLNVGRKDANSKAPVDENTLFEIGSVSKAMTSTALAAFVTEGKIKLDDPVQAYLPDSVTLPIRNDKPITFKSLANHRSGLPRLPNNMPFDDPLDPYSDYTTELLFKFLNDYELPRDVGQTPEYSNLAVGLLGQTLALINNSSYEKMLSDKVLAPLNMKSTYIDVPESQLSKRSKGHNNALVETSFWRFPSLAGAGAVVSSTSDMVRYLKANMKPQTLADAIKLTHTPTASFGSPEYDIGLGWLIKRNHNGNGDIYFHNGQTGGFASFVGFNPSSNKGIVLLSNVSVPLDDIALAYLTDSVGSIALETPVSIPAETLAKLVGKYELMPGFVITVTHESDRLFIQATGQPKLPMIAKSPVEFVHKAAQATIKFEVDESGNATSLNLLQGGRVMPGKKLD